MKKIKKNKKSSCNNRRVIKRLAAKNELDNDTVNLFCCARNGLRKEAIIIGGALLITIACVVAVLIDINIVNIPFWQ